MGYVFIQAFLMKLGWTHGEQIQINKQKQKIYFFDLKMETKELKLEGIA